MLTPINSGFYNTSAYGYTPGGINAFGASDIFGQTNPLGDDEYKSTAEKRAAIQSGKEECETCKNRKYKDGSDEMVSYKSATHISPEAAAGAVRAHEQEHVANAYKKEASGNAKVLQASVSIQTAICPECGRSYVAGGTTSTQIKYYNEDNPYQKDLKTTDGNKYKGMNVNLAV